jgi:hypothetical protein
MRKQRRISPNIDVASPAFTVIVTRFGGLPEFCQLTEIATSTAYDMLRTGVISVKRQPHILAVSAKYRKGVRPGDFVPEASSNG